MERWGSAAGSSFGRPQSRHEDKQGRRGGAGSVPQGLEVLLVGGLLQEAQLFSFRVLARLQQLEVGRLEAAAHHLPHLGLDSQQLLLQPRGRVPQLPLRLQDPLRHALLTTPLHVWTAARRLASRVTHWPTAWSGQLEASPRALYCVRTGMQAAARVPVYDSTCTVRHQPLSLASHYV